MPRQKYLEYCSIFWFRLANDVTIEASDSVTHLSQAEATARAFCGSERLEQPVHNILR